MNGKVIELTSDWQWAVECLGAPEYMERLLLRPAQIDRGVRPRMRPGALVIMEFIDDLWRVTDVSYLTVEDLDRVAGLVEPLDEEGATDMREWYKTQEKALSSLRRALGARCTEERQATAEFAWRWLTNGVTS